MTEDEKKQVAAFRFGVICDLVNGVQLASGVVARSHLEGLDLEGMHRYLAHHLNLAGIKTSPFEDAAITAIHQGSGGLLRKSNHLARGALIAAASDQFTTVNAEHVRRAATEIF